MSKKKDLTELLEQQEIEKDSALTSDAEQELHDQSQLETATKAPPIFLSARLPSTVLSEKLLKTSSPISAFNPLPGCRDSARLDSARSYVSTHRAEGWACNMRSM